VEFENIACKFRCLLATTVLLYAIVHTFFALQFVWLSERITRSKAQATLCHFLAEIEEILGFGQFLDSSAWSFFGWHTLGHQLNVFVSVAELIFLIIITAISATHPVLSLSESLL
jgi:hypothetical protein